MLRRLILALFIAPNLAGCVHYAYPTVIYTPEQPIENADGSAHAFRVDIDRTERKPQASSVQFTLMKIPLDTRGIVPSQLEVAPASGVYNPLGVSEGVEHERTDYTINIRLYRPGYETKELKAWDKARSPKWTPARDLLAQEKAIDDLLAIPDAGQRPIDGTVKNIGTLVSGTWWEFREEKTPSLQQGSVSKSQHDALMFASGEYQRLASSPGAGAANMTAVRERLQQKAIYLRKYAETTAR